VTGGVPTTSHRGRAFLGSRGGYRKVHFMRIQNSYATAVAAAVSAVVFSAAFQPAANAAPIVLDSFTNQSTPTTIASGTASLLLRALNS
jgi:hypothetical protein